MGASLLRGIVPAVVTPFREDESIDYAAWQEVLDRLMGQRIKRLH
jgi:dihydrodipicolinate synthase/N-acetylneuraminate lyase